MVELPAHQDDFLSAFYRFFEFEQVQRLLDEILSAIFHCFHCHADLTMCSDNNHLGAHGQQRRFVQQVWAVAIG